MKICLKCKTEKSNDQFYAKKSSKDGLDTRCKKCVNEGNKAWCEKNKEKANARFSRYKKSHREFVSKYNAQYQKENYDRCRELRKKYYHATKNNLEVRERDRIKCSNRRSRIKYSGGKLSSDLVSRLMKLQKGMCICCKKKLDDGYHLDHIMPLALGGEHVDGNIQLLCPACNNKKSAKHPVEFMQTIGFLL